jgi:hypothetical protein
VRKNGTFVDFERLNFPRASRIAPQDAAEFASIREKFSAMMDPEPEPALSE